MRHLSGEADDGDHKFRLDSMIVSYSDMDHSSGLHDIICDTTSADHALGCPGGDIKTFPHPGLSLWTNMPGATPRHFNGLGPKAAGGFFRWLGDRVEETETLFDLGAKSKNSNGHSICLWINHKQARVLLTGDLNTKSTHWPEDCCGDRISVSSAMWPKPAITRHDVSHRFLEAINAGATLLSSGDEGRSHHRLEIVGGMARSSVAPSTRSARPGSSLQRTGKI